MTERPILFSTPMVRAIDQDRKKVTRRSRGLDTFNAKPDEWDFIRILEVNGEYHAFFTSKDKDAVEGEFGGKCPYGILGDLLWVRETFGLYDLNEDDQSLPNLQPVYKAQMDDCGQVPLVTDPFKLVTFKETWRPSIHMPKNFARIWLSISGIRVERLQDINASDAIAEGIEELKPWPEVPDRRIFKTYHAKGTNHFSEDASFDPVFSFFSLWISINGSDSVLNNPWVWVIEYEKIPQENNLHRNHGERLKNSMD